MNISTPPAIFRQILVKLSQKRLSIVHFLHRIQKLCGLALRQGHDVLGVPRCAVLEEAVLIFLTAVPRAFP